jgi:hypothetical protein
MQELKITVLGRGEVRHENGTKLTDFCVYNSHG